MKKHYLIILILFITQDSVAQDFSKCNYNRDCVILFDSWCKLPVAINQNYVRDWIKIDSLKYEKSKNDRQTCKPYSEKALYFSLCENNICTFGVFKSKEN